MAKTKSTSTLKMDKPLEVEHLLAGSIKPNSYNPNIQLHKEFMLTLKSMYDEGMDQPVIVNRASREIVDGEHRWRGWIVLHELVSKGLWNNGKPEQTKVEELRARPLELTKTSQKDLKIPIVLTDLTPEQMRIATLRRNRARGFEDQNLLTNVFRELEQINALEVAGESLEMSNFEIKAMVGSAADLLAGDKIGEAWEPDPASAGPKTKSKKNNPAPTDDTTNDAPPEPGMFVVHAVYSGEEAELVRAVLNDTNRIPGKILEWCRNESSEI